MKRTLGSLVALGLVAALAGVVSGEALILKDGRKLVGRVNERPEYYEITVEGQQLTFAKDEVQKWIKTPKDVIGDADKLVEEAKAIYLQAVEMKDEREAENQFKLALPKVQQARNAYAEARDLFPDGYPELDAQLVNIMKLMRLIRERIGSELAGGGSAPVKVKSAPPPPPKVAPPPPVVAPSPTTAPTPVAPTPVIDAGPANAINMADAMAVLIDPVKRADPKQRRDAREAFHNMWQQRVPLADAAAAGYVFLSKSDRDWQLITDTVAVKSGAGDQKFQGALEKKSDTLSILHLADGRDLRLRKASDGVYVQLPGAAAETKASEVKVASAAPSEEMEALQDFFKGLGADKLEQLSAAEITDGVTFLARKVKELKAKDGADATESLELFVAALASALIAKGGGKSVPALEAAFKDLGYIKSEYGNVWGEKPGLAIDDYKKWVTSGEYSLAVVQFQNDYKALEDFGVRYAQGLLMIFKAVADNRNYNKAAAYLELTARNVKGAPAREHLYALAKSVRAASPCPACGGAHKVNCTACKGKKKATFQCTGCGGSGKVVKGTVVACPACKGQGMFRNVECLKCKGDGSQVCKGQGCKEAVEKPTFESFADAYQCPSCKGKGSLLNHVAHPCLECAGIGLLLQPKSDPTKMIR